MRRWALIIGALVLPAASHGACDRLPPGASFVGLTESGWQGYVTDSAGELQKVALEGEARTPVYSPEKGALVYVDEANRIRRHQTETQSTETLLATDGGDAHTQPAFGPRGNLYLVALKGGNSVDTDIVSLDPASGELEAVLEQRSAQFDPHWSGDWLYYSNVHCVSSCGRIIQEVWRYNPVSSQAEQLTMLGHISRQPVLNAEGNWLYFTSNRAGHYHIYRQSLAEGDLERLTRGPVTDRFPAVVDGTLYFLREDHRGSRLMCRDGDNEAKPLSLPEEIQRIRDFEVNS